MTAAGVLATFKSGKPAIVEHVSGKGRTTYIATLPGVAYLWSAYQPKPGESYLVPARGPSSHMELSNFNPQAGRWVSASALAISADVEAHGALIDARLLQSPNGYAVVLSNYSPDAAAPITLTIRNPKSIKQVTSANRGKLKLQRNKDGSVTMRYAPGLGDILRLNR